MILTVKQLANHMQLSEPRIRHYLGLDGAPTPVVESVSLGNKGKKPGRYDFDEFKEFVEENRGKRKARYW